MTSATPTIHAHNNHPIDGRVTCQNCDHDYTGRYCNQCGQRADTHPVSWHYIWHEIPHSVWHIDRGIAYTLRQLLTRPGHTIREFLEGKRINHYRPLALLLILGAVVVFVQHGLDVSIMKSSQGAFGTPNADASARIQAFQAQAFAFIERNQNLINIATIPLYAFWLWFMFRRRGYNYPQMLVAQTFIANFGLVVSLTVTLLMWLLGSSPAIFRAVMSFTLLALIGYLVVVCLQLFRGKLPARSIVFRSIAAWVLAYLNYMLIAGLIGVGYGIYVGYQEGQAHKITKPATTTQQPHK